MPPYPSVPDAPPSAVRWRVMWWLAIASVVAYVLRFNLSVAGPAMMHDLGLTEAQLGLVLGAFAWSYGLLQVPGGMLGERFGPRRTLAVAFVCWFATTALMALVPHGLPLVASMGMLLLLRAAQGVTQAPIFPVACGAYFAWLPPSSWGLANSLSAAGTTVGAALAGPGIAWLVGAVGWRQSFLAVAPLALVLALGWWHDYRDDPATHRGTNAAELALIQGGRAPAFHAAPVPWIKLLAHRDILCLTLGYACMNYVFYLFFNWFFYYLTEIRHVTSALAGAFTAAQWMIGAVTALAGGWTCDRLSTRLGARHGCRVTAVSALLVCAPLLVAGTLATSPVLNVTLLSLAFGCTQFVDSAYWAATMRIAGPQAQSATGLMNTGGNVAGGIGAVLVPLLAAPFGWSVALGSGALCALGAAALWFAVRADLALQEGGGPVAPGLLQPVILTVPA